jgi:hypothetical protein
LPVPVPVPLPVPVPVPLPVFPNPDRQGGAIGSCPLTRDLRGVLHDVSL